MENKSSSKTEEKTGSKSLSDSVRKSLLEVADDIKGKRRRKSAKAKLKGNKVKINFKPLLIISPIILVFLFFVFSVLRIYTTMSPQTYLPGDASGAERPLSNYNNGFNVVFLGLDKSADGNYVFIKSIVVTSIDLDNNKMYTYGVNPAIYNNLPDFNTFTVENVFNNTTVDYTGKMDLIIKAIESILAIRIDRYIAFDDTNLSNIITTQTLSFTTDNDGTKNGSDLASFLIKGDNNSNLTTKTWTEFISSYLVDYRDAFFKFRSFLEINNLLKYFYTDMTASELLLYFSEASSISTVPFTSYTQVADQDATTSTAAADGLTLDYLDLDTDITNTFERTDILSEQAAIEIYNSSDVQGGAIYESRVLQHLGSTIVRTGNYPITLNQTTLYLPNNNGYKFSATIDAIKKEFRDNINIIEGGYKYNYSGDMVLVLGSNYQLN